MNDVFNSNLFSLISLTEAVNHIPFKPSRIGQLGIFEEEGVATTSVVIEEKDGLLALLPTKRRGEPATVSKREKRVARSLTIPHIPFEETILAEAVQNVRAFGTENQLESVATVVNNALAKMRMSHEVTLEYLRAGALRGAILDANGSTSIYNLFTEFGVSETTVSFALTVATTKVKDKCLQVKRAIEDALGALPYTGIRALCGSTWFSNFIKHEDVEAAYDRYQEGAFLRTDPRAGFDFAGITFEEYRGTVSGVSFFDATQARFIPVGVPGLYKTYYAPADFMETVNTIGLPYYAKSERMPFDRGINLHTQSNPLPICLRPACLIKGT